mmetsp:Transcript_36598/g.58708  ORF Transcript_36598/g.58708 Transcript_36598/m.58708 type:complete len:161 (-) Transcript_36598:66-548(-)
MASTSCAAAVNLVLMAALAQSASLDRDTAVALLTRGVTTAMAMPINQMMSSEVRCAHLPVLTAGICTSCGLFGAIVSPFLIKLMRITSPSQSALRGISAGSSAHGLGAAIFAGSDPRAFVYGVVTFGMVGAWSAMLLSESSPFKEVVVALLPPGSAINAQ